MTWRRVAAGTAVIVGCTAVALAWTRLVPAAARRIPTARVQRGRVQVTVYATGELRAGRAALLVAPPNGGMLQIV